MTAGSVSDPVSDPLSDPLSDPVAAPVAAAVVDTLRRGGGTVATAESLTGGLLCSALICVPGASEVVRGGVVAYAADVKVSVLGVDGGVVERHGTVAAETAAAMAVAARDRFDATWGVSTTGVAGPDRSEGKDVGTVFVAVAGPDGVSATALSLSGDRARIRAETVAQALSVLLPRLTT